MSDSLDYLRSFVQFPLAVRRFSRQNLTLTEARRIVRERMQQRGERFLAVMERSVYGHRRSPYLALLKNAGCTFGDLANLVRRNGLEEALRTVRGAGVYVTFEEFKGRKPIERPGLSLPVQPRDFDNPYARKHFTMQSGGSTGVSTLVGQDLDYLAASAPAQMLELDAHGVDGRQAIVYGHILLPGPGMRFILQRTYAGVRLRRVFAAQGLRESKYWVKYGLATYYMLLWIRLSGNKSPFPEYAPSDQALKVARSVHELLQEAGQCLVFAGVSRALRVCLAAQEAGLDLTGAVFRGGGEPVSNSKAQAVQRVGAKMIPGYSMMEAGTLGLGCANPLDVSDLHLAMDSLALITSEQSVHGWDEPVPAFNLTTLLDTAPKLMLNVQMDDYGIVEERQCGCAMGEAGFTTHVRAIRSYTKLTGEGATLIAGDMMRILEEVLPAKFGGSLMDYQLAEEEDEQGLSRMFLIISPRVPPLDEAAVVSTLLKSLGESSSMADAARAVWQRAESIVVRRGEPLLTGRGKFMPIVLRRPEPKPVDAQVGGRGT